MAERERNFCDDLGQPSYKASVYNAESCNIRTRSGPGGHLTQLPSCTNGKTESQRAKVTKG